MTTKSLSHQAYQRLKQRIVSLDLSPGTVIDETRLMVELDVGRTPLREALQRLALEKLVVIVPRRGMYVSDIGITSLQALFEVRLVLESLAARQAALRGQQSHWEEMRLALARVCDAEDRPGNELLISVDEACHLIIYEAANNEFLQDTLVTMYALSLRLWYFFLNRIGDMRTAVLEHARILQALQEGDGQRAASLMEQHIRAFQEEIQSVMIGEPS